MYAAMAQLVEHIRGKDEVPGPNPGSSSRQPRRETFGALVFYKLLQISVGAFFFMGLSGAATSYFASGSVPKALSRKLLKKECYCTLFSFYTVFVNIAQITSAAPIVVTIEIATNTKRSRCADAKKITFAFVDSLLNMR